MAEQRTQLIFKDPSEAELRAQIEETKASLSEKVSALTQEIRSEVKQTLNRVATTVEQGVSTVSGSIDDSVQQIGRSVSGAVDGLRTTVDIPDRVRAHPLPMIGLSMVLGFVATGLLKARRRHTEERHYQPPRPKAPEQPLLSISPPEVKRMAGPVALAGIVFTALRPILVAAARDAAKEFVVQKVIRSADRSAEQPVAASRREGEPIYQ